MTRLAKIFLRIAGTFFVGVAIVGIFLPLLPTTPLLLLAAVCYAKSSTRLYDWLLGNRYFGNYIKNYRERKGIPLRVKIISISLLILTIAYTSIFVVDVYWGRICLFLIAVGVSIHILSFPTLRAESLQDKTSEYEKGNKKNGKKAKLFVLLLVCSLRTFYSFPVFSEEINRKAVFLFLPMTGWIRNEVEFSIPGNCTKESLKDDGQLHGIYMMCATPKFVLGSLGHYSKLDKTYENGYLFFTYYYFRQEKEIQPMIGFAVDYIHFYTQLTTEDVSPLTSLDVDTSIWAFHPTIGVSYKNGNFRISPFVGYFNEQVNTVVSSPGMKMAGQNRYGFKRESSVSLDYISAGSKFEITLYHLVKLDTKFYFRFKQNEPALYTLRNRVDFYLSKELGFSTKIDYFQDKYETNFFLFFGPSFAL